MNLATFDTEYSADSVEYCPQIGFQDHIAVGTYQVLEREEHQTETQRTGRLLLFKTIDDEHGCFQKMEEIQRIDTNAILDMKWSHQKDEFTINEPLLAVADARSKIQIYSLKTHLDLKTEFQNKDPSILNLSLDWGNRLDKHNTNIVFSQSNGNITVLKLKEDGNLEKEHEWRGHSLEAWIAAYDYWSTQIIYTGADDCLFKKWDLRVGTNQPILTSKQHSAGVCSIHSHPSREFTMATGSYDEHLFILDTRQMKRPVSEYHVGGGVWRLKWHPEDPSLILAAAMHDGFHILQVDKTDQVQVIKQYREHASLAYGADWCFNKQNRVGTCSFYDHLFKLWEF